MSNIAKLISLVALLATILPSMMYFTSIISHEAVKMMALVGTITWFIATPLWMSRKLPVDASEVEI